MTKENDPAFPIYLPPTQSQNFFVSGSLRRGDLICTGLTKREYFEAQAMQGILTGIHSSSEAFNNWEATARKHNVSPEQLVARTATIFVNEFFKED